MSLLSDIREFLSSAAITVATKGNVFEKGNFSVRLPEQLTIDIADDGDGFGVSLNPALKASGPCGLGASIKTLRIEENGVYARMGWPIGDYKIMAIPEPPQAYAGKPRSSQWDEVRGEHLEKFPTCAACGGDSELQVHHVRAFSTHPELELSSDNLITLCMHGTRQCHWHFGHLARSWSVVNPKVREMAAMFLELREAA